MPRQVGAGGSSRAHMHNQINAAQGDKPAPPPRAEADTPPKAPGTASPASRNKGGQQSLRLHKQMRAADTAKAKELRGKLDDYFDTLSDLELEYVDTLNKGRDDMDRCKNAGALIALDPEKNGWMKKLADAQLDRAILTFDLAASVWDKNTIEGVSVFNSVSAALDSVESLPNKDRLYTLDLDLKDSVERVKGRFAELGRDKVAATSFAIDGITQRALGRQHQILDHLADLARSVAAGNDSDAAGRDALARTVAELDGIAADMAAARERGNKQVEACEKLLENPEVIKDPALKKDARGFRQGAFFNNANLSIRIADNTEAKIRIHMSGVQYDNAGERGHPELDKWAQSMRSLFVEHHTAVAVNLKLMDEEKAEHWTPVKLSEAERLLRLEAAIDGPNQLDKIVRAYKKRAAEYERLPLAVKDGKLSSLLNEMAANVGECMRNREHAAQIAADKIAEARTEALNLALFAPPASSSRPAHGQSLQQTKEGVVVGTVNPQGGLDGLDESGNTIASYLMDEDSGIWVRDYGDEPGAVAAAPAAGAAPGRGKAASGKSSEDVLSKARRIVDSSNGLARSIRDDVAASGDYDEKVRLLHRAFADKVGAIAKLSAALADLKEAQAGEGAGKDRSAALRELLAGLREDRRALDKQLQQAQLDMRIHAHKCRDPNGESFNELWKQGQVASIVKTLTRSPNRNNPADLLDRYVIAFDKGPRDERYDPWVVHAHFNAAGANASPARVHMKRYAERDWGVDQQAYHSRALTGGTFELLKREARPAP